MGKTADWWTSPTENEAGELVMVSGRRDIEKFRDKRRFSVRVEITWKYAGEQSGMPDFETSKKMEAVQAALEKVFDSDPVAVLTGVYTGAGERNWVFYTLNTLVFDKRLNEALAGFERLPIGIYAENDPDWREYSEMRDLSEIL